MKTKNEELTLLDVVKEAQVGSTERLKNMVASLRRKRETTLLMAEKQLSDLDARISVISDLLAQIEEENELGREEMDHLDTNDNTKR